MRRDEFIDRALATGVIERGHRVYYPVALAGEEEQQRRVALPAVATPAGEVVAMGEDQDDGLRAGP